MVKALVTLSDQSNRALKLVKAKYELKDKGEAMEFIITRYMQIEGEPEISDEYVKKLKEILKGKHHYVGSFEDLKNRYE